MSVSWCKFAKKPPGSQRGSTGEMSKYVLFLHSEASHPLPLNPIVTIFASNWSWHYELHEDVLGFTWVTLCANWQGFKLTMTTQTLIGWFCMGKQHVLAYIPNYLVVSLHIFCNGDFCYKDSIPRDTLWFGLVGGLLWRFCGEKWGLRTLRAIRHVRRNRLISSLGPRGSSTDSTKLEISQFWRKYSSHISKVTPFGASDDYL